MKSVLVAFAVICIMGVFAEVDKRKEDIDACITESGVTQKIFDDMKNQKDFKSTRELDCFAACILKKEGIMDAEGNVKPNKPGENEESIKCSALRGNDACDTAGKIMGCFSKNNLISLFDE